MISYGSAFIYAWDLPSNKLLQRWDRNEGSSFALSPKGEYFYQDAPGEIVERSVESGEVLRSLSTPNEHLIAIATSPDGRRLATLGLNCKMRMFDVISGTAMWERDVRT